MYETVLRKVLWDMVMIEALSVLDGFAQVLSHLRVDQTRWQSLHEGYVGSPESRP